MRITENRPLQTGCFTTKSPGELTVVHLKPGAMPPARSNRVAVTKIRDREFQADAIVADGRLRPVLYDPGANFVSREQALRAALRWAARNGAGTVYVEPLIDP